MRNLDKSKPALIVRTPSVRTNPLFNAANWRFHHQLVTQSLASLMISSRDSLSMMSLLLPRLEHMALRKLPKIGLYPRTIIIASVWRCGESRQTGLPFKPQFRQPLDKAHLQLALTPCSRSSLAWCTMFGGLLSTLIQHPLC